MLLISTSAIAQKQVDESQLKKIIIRDKQDYRSQGYFGTYYEIVPEGGKYVLIRTKQYVSLDRQTFKDVDLVNDEKPVRVGDIPKEKIQQLIKAVNDTATTLSAKNLGINKSWIEQNMKQYFLHAQKEIDGPKAGEAALCMDMLRNQEQIEGVLAKFYSGYWDLDYPVVEVRIIAGVDTVNLYSEKQQSFMLPWTVNQKTENYNPNISKALADLLPTLRYSNINRLKGTDFNYDFAEALYEHICNPTIELLRKREEHRAEFEKLEKQFKIKNYSFIRRSDVEIDGYFLKATLISPTLPENVVIDGKFSLRGTKMNPTDPLVNKAPQLISTLKSSGWFYDYLNKNPSVTAVISFANDRSFTDRAQNFFQNDTKIFIDKNKLRDIVKDAVLLTVYEEKGKYSRWIILPDGRVVLWHYKGSGALKFTDAQLDKGGVTEPLKVVGRFVGESGVVK